MAPVYSLGFPGGSNWERRKENLQTLPHWSGESHLLSVFVSFHFLVLLGPCILLKDRLEKENSAGELEGHTGGTQGVGACVEHDDLSQFLPSMANSF